ncbi:MAG: pyrroline-5-carboxylate reductase [Myxococcales bacterium]|nr:pyrroline-5-carboxylate reductase [Myxococcales bacterium]
MRIGLIGAGNLGEALVRGVGAAFGRVLVAEKRSERLDFMVATYGVEPSTVSSLMSQAEVVIVAVKPTQIAKTLGEMAAAVTQQQIIVSVAAGVSLSQIALYLGAERQLVRVMPNTPAAVGAGVSAIFHPAGERGVLDKVHAVFSCVGDVVEVQDESWFDAITALSGSGPAYICLVLEALVEGGVKAGLPRDVASRLALGTLRGTAALVDARDGDAAATRHAVTSPGGTTAYGLAVLEQRATRSAFIEAVAAAAQRGHELGQRS